MRADTVYGLHGSAPATRARLKRLKQRSADKPFLLLVADAAAAAAVTGAPVPPALAALWPAPLTLILPVVQPPRLPVAAGAATLALRVPADPNLRAILAAVGTPLYSTSANRPGAAPLADPAALRAAYAGAVDLIVDDGPAGAALPSTIVDVTVAPPRIVRAGALPLSAAQLDRLNPAAPPPPNPPV